MLSLQGYLDLLNDKNYSLPAHIDKWQQVYYGMSLHIDGVCPCYKTLRNPGLKWEPGNLSTIYPTRWCGMAYQYIFENQLFSRHPREPELTRQWRLSQYKPFTQAPFLQVIQVITGGIFQDSGYQLTIEDREDNEYIWGHHFEGYSLVQYISHSFQQIAEDPNGLFVVIPREPYYATNTSRIAPTVYFIPSRNILHHTGEEIVFMRDGMYWAVNRMGYFRFITVQDKIVPYPEDVPHGGYYAHYLGYVPAVVAGGQWNTQGYYDSWLNAAKPVADEFVAAKSAEQLVNKEASHPFVVAASEDCPDCEGGKIRYCTQCNHDSEACNCGSHEHWSIRNCNHCGGSGEVSRNPGQWMIVPIEDMDKDAIKLVNPSVDINRFHADNNRDIYNAIMRALHLDYIEEAQSGTAKDKDMETRYQFLLRISNDLFDRVITKLCNTITALRNVRGAGGNLVPAPSPMLLVKPTQFRIKTAQELLGEYETATRAQVPDHIRMAQLEDYVDKLYGGDVLLKRKTELINRMDAFAVMSMSDISAALANGADTAKYKLHTELPMILDALVREKGRDWLLKAGYDVIKEEVEKRMTPPDSYRDGS